MTYTAEQARSSLQKMHGHPLTVAERAELFSMASNYADLLRERESAKAAVTDEMIEVAVNAHAEWFGGHRGMCAALEAVAPMLASARVPAIDCIGLALALEQQSTLCTSQTMQRAIDAAAHALRLLASARVPAKRDLSLCVTEYQLALDTGFNQCVDAMLAAAPKPEKE